MAFHLSKQIVCHFGHKPDILPMRTCQKLDVYLTCRNSSSGRGSTCSTSDRGKGSSSKHGTAVFAQMSHTNVNRDTVFSEALIQHCAKPPHTHTLLSFMTFSRCVITMFLFLISKRRHRTAAASLVSQNVSGQFKHSDPR